MECNRNLGIILKEMYTNKNFFKNKKNHGRRLFQWSDGDANQLIFLFGLITTTMYCKIVEIAI